MKTQDKWFFWVAAVLCVLATGLNVYSVAWMKEEAITYGIGLMGFIFSLLSHVFFIVVCLVLGAKYSLKRWALWLCFLHPIIALVVFAWVNSETLFQRSELASRGLE